MALPVLAVLAAVAAAKAYGAHKAAKKKERAAKDQANLNNAQNEQTRLAQLKMMAGLQDAGWNPFGVNQLTSGGESTSTSSGRQDFYSKENPFVTAEYGKMDELVRGIMENRLSRGSSLPPGYEANAIRAINEASAGGAAAAGNVAARRGLSGQQVFGLNAPIQTARAGKIADLRGNVPLLERSLANEDIGIEGQRQAQFGTGQERRGTTTTSERRSGRESGFRDVGPDVNALSTLLMPPGAKQSTVSPYSGSSALFSGIGDVGMAVAGGMAGGGGGGGGGNPFGVGGGGGFSNPQLTCPGRGVYPNCY